MDNKNKKTLDDFLKDKLSDIQPPYQEQEWEDFSARYKKEKKRRGLFYLIPAGLIVISLSAWGIYHFMGSEKQPAEKLYIVSNTPTETQIPETGPIKEDKAPGSTYIETKANPNTASSQNSPSSGISAHREASTGNNIPPAVSFAHRKQSPTPVSKKDIDSKNTKDIYTSIAKGDGDDKKIVSETIPVNGKEVTPAPQKEVKSDPETPKKINTDPIPNPDSLTPKTPANQTPPDSKHKFKPSFYIKALAGSGTWKQNELSNGISGGGQEEKISGMYKNLLAANLLTGLQWRQHWAAETGIGYTNVQSAVSINWKTEVSSSSVRIDSFLRMDTSQRRIRMKIDTTITVHSSTQDHSATGYIQYQYISVPLHLVYIYELKNWNLTASGGVTWYHLVQTHISLPGTAPQMLLVNQIPHNMFGIIFSPAVEWKISQRLGICLQPTVTRITGNSDDYKQKALMLQGSAGIKIKL